MIKDREWKLDDKEPMQSVWLLSENITTNHIASISVAMKKETNSVCIAPTVSTRSLSPAQSKLYRGQSK